MKRGRGEAGKGKRDPTSIFLIGKTLKRLKVCVIGAGSEITPIPPDKSGG